MRKTIEQKIADLQRKQRFELLRSNVKEHIAEVKAAMASCSNTRPQITP